MAIKPNADRIFSLYIAEVDSNGDVVQKLTETTGDFEVIEFVAKRKLRALRAEFKGNGADPVPPVDTNETDAL